MPFARFRRLPALQRHTVLASAFTLFLTLAAHQLMETARDALFLQHIPAERLPWMYLAIAGISLGIVRAVALARHLFRPRLLLILWIAASAVVTFGFSALTPRPGREWLLYALYVWTGVVATITLLQFWTMLSSIANIDEAKDSFAIAGGGSVLGAIAGSAAATALAEAGYPDTLLTLAGVLFVVSAVGPIWLGRLHGEALDARNREEGRVDSVSRIVEDVFGQPYVRTLLVVVFVGMATVTLVDFVFKSVVADQVAGTDLTHFFAWFYLGTNAASLITQVLLVQWMLRRLTVTGSLAAMPALIFAGAATFVAGAGLIAVGLMRAVDGALRHSLHRTATEVLYVPMRSGVRRRVKAVLDVLGHRGAQAVLSLGVLLALELGATMTHFGSALIALSLGWLGAVVAMRLRYVEVFRDRLRFAAAAPEADFPDLDLDSLESLMRALSDPDDRRVIAALDLLEEEGRSGLIPTLLIHHPSVAVVLRLFEIFSEAERTDFFRHAEHLAEHPSAAVRAELVASIARTSGDVAFLHDTAAREDPPVAAVAKIFLFDHGELDVEETREGVLAALGTPGSDHAIARALAETARLELEPIYERLLRSNDKEARRVAVEAAGNYPATPVALALRDLLEDRELRPYVREALVGLGDKGRIALEKSLRDEQLPPRLRWQIPEALAGFDDEATLSLWRAFVAERDGVMRHRILLALTAVMTSRQAERLKPDLMDEVRATTRRAWELRHWYDEVRGGPHSSYQRLLLRVLEDKREHATDVALRLVALTDHGAARDFASIRDGLRSGSEVVRASSRELLEHLVDGDLRRRLIGLLEDGSHLPSAYDFISYSFEEILRRMLWGESRLIAAIAARVAIELGEPDLLQAVRERREDADEELAAVVDRGLQARGDTERESA